MSYDPIEQEIIDALKALTPYGYDEKWTKDQWTQGILGLIGAIGWRKEYSFCSTKKLQNNQAFVIRVLNDIQVKLNRTLYDPARDKFVDPQYFGEFLYDIVWLKYDIDYKQKHLITEREFKRNFDHFTLIDSLLVGESDWGYFGDVKEDFEKLLLARSTYRIMVFSVTDENQFNQYIRRLTELIRQYKSSQPGDRYLFCGTDEGQHKFRFNQFIVP